MDKFMDWYNMSTDGTFDMDLMAKRAKNRFHESIQSNPNFYYGPVTGLIARNAGYIFSGRLFRNHSRENPDGVLSKFIFSLGVLLVVSIILTLKQPRVTFGTSMESTVRRATLHTVRAGSGSLKIGSRPPSTMASSN